MSKLTKSVSRLKQEAKSLRRQENLTHVEALDLVARKYQFPNWAAVLKAEQELLAKSRPVPKPSLSFFKSEDVSSTEDELSAERNVDLPDQHKVFVAKNQAYFVSQGIEFSMFEPTATGLKKSILDATFPVRDHFSKEEFHFYDRQVQGPENKVLRPAFFVSHDSTVETTVSLYRPNTKSGDPRMWFSKLANFAEPADQIAIVVFEGALYLFNFSCLDLDSISESSFVLKFISLYVKSKGSVADELLAKLREIAKNPLPAEVDADTAIGRAIEAALGIKSNSSKLPDYKGIELKAGRMKGNNRSNLFAQVANWEYSPCKSSAEILDKYGYQRGDDFKLYCTVSTQKPNSQGLQFFYHQSNDLLVERHVDNGDVAIWTGDTLRNRLLEKHAETFWINAKSIQIGGTEHFQLVSVTHTKKPIQSQLMSLIESGVITMDHLIKRKVESNGKTKVSEKGPLFKIDKRDLKLLFPDPITIPLI